MSYRFIKLVWLLAAITKIESSTPSPPTPTCDQSLIKGITNFWEDNGTPQNIMKSMEDGGDYVIVLTTYDALNGKNKCIFLNGTTAGNKLKFIYPPKNDDDKVITLDYVVEERNGNVYDKRWQQGIYYILFNNNVIAGYVCTTKQDESGPPVGYIAVARNQRTNSRTQTTLKTAQGLMEKMGFDFIYQYGDECFK